MALRAEVEAQRQQREIDYATFYDMAAQRDALRARGERFAVSMRHARRVLDEALVDEPVMAAP